MKRRKAIQALSASLGALLVVPAWATGWSRQSLGTRAALLNSHQALVLDEVVTTLIPEGPIAGAKSLGVPTFIEKMLADCYEKPVQEAFKAGLDAVEAQAKIAYNKSFADLQPSERLALLTTFQQTENIPQKEFFALLKNLTIQGYTTSEYVMVNHLRYEMAPGHYYGCVPV